MTRPIVLFDLDDTLLDFHKAERIAIAKTFKELGIEPTEEVIQLYSKINARQWKRLETGEISREQVLVGRFEILFKELGLDLPSRQAKALYENFLSQGNCLKNCRGATGSLSVPTARQWSRRADLKAPAFHRTLKRYSFPRR